MQHTSQLFLARVSSSIVTSNFPVIIPFPMSYSGRRRWAKRYANKFLSPFLLTKFFSVFFFYGIYIFLRKKNYSQKIRPSIYHNLKKIKKKNNNVKNKIRDIKNILIFRTKWKKKSFKNMKTYKIFKYMTHERKILFMNVVTCYFFLLYFKNFFFCLCFSSSYLL